MPWWESEQQVKEKKAKEQAKKARRWGDPDKGSGGRGQDYFQRQAEANRRERERREAAEAAAQRRAEQDYWEGEKARNDAQRQRQQEAAAAAAEMQKFQTAAEVRAVRPPTTQQTPGGRPMGGPQGRPSETEEDEQEFQEEIARAPVWIAEQQQIGSAHTAAPPEPEIIALNSFNDEAKSFLLRAALDTLVSLGKLQAMAGGGMVAQLTGQNKADIVELAEALDPVGTVFEYGTRAALDEYGLAGGAYEYLPLMVGMIGSVGTAAFTGGQAGTGGAAVKGGKLAALVGRNADDIVAILAREMKSPDFIREYIKRTSPEEYAELAAVIGRRLKGTIFGQPGHLISPADADVILKKAAPVADEMTQAGYRSVTAGGDVAIGMGEGAAKTGAPQSSAFSSPAAIAYGRNLQIRSTAAGVNKQIAGEFSPHGGWVVNTGETLIKTRNWQAAADDLAQRLAKQAGMTADEAMAVVRRIAGDAVQDGMEHVQSADDFVEFAGKVLDEAGVVLPVGRWGGAGLGAAAEGAAKTTDFLAVIPAEDVITDIVKYADDPGAAIVAYGQEAGTAIVRYGDEVSEALTVYGNTPAAWDSLRDTIPSWAWLALGAAIGTVAGVPIADALVGRDWRDATTGPDAGYDEISLDDLWQMRQELGIHHDSWLDPSVKTDQEVFDEFTRLRQEVVRPPTDTDRLGEAGMPGALAQQAIAEGLPASVVEERERVVAREHADDELTALLESFELAEGQLSSTEPTIRKETDDGLLYTVNGLETGEVVAVAGPDGVTLYLTPEDAAEYEGNEARLDADIEAITVGEGEEGIAPVGEGEEELPPPLPEAERDLWQMRQELGIHSDVWLDPNLKSDNDVRDEYLRLQAAALETGLPQTGMTAERPPGTFRYDPETGDPVEFVGIESDEYDEISLDELWQMRQELGIHSDVWLDPSLKSDQEVHDEWVRLWTEDPRGDVVDAEEVGGDEGGDEVLVDGDEEGEPGTDNPFGELVAIPDQTHDPDLLEGQWDELQNMAFIVREAAGLTREGAMERYGWGEDVFDMAEQYVKWYAADYGQTPEEFLRAQQAAGWAYHHGGGAPPGPPSDTVSNEDREESSGGLPGDGGDNNPGYSFNESGNAAGPVSQYAMYGEGLQNSDVTYGITNQPSWWQSYVPAKQGPLADYLGVLNAVMPYLASQDAMAVGSNLYRNAPKEFSAYSSANLNLPVTQDLDIGLFMNKTWVENMVTAMDGLREAQGYDAGPGYTWMHDFLNTIMRYLPVEGGRQRRADYESMLAAIEPMLSSASSQTETAAYVSLARMVYYPTSIGNKGRIVPEVFSQPDPALG